MHRNVPGVLRDINRIVSDLNANIQRQMLATDPNIGYLIMDLDQDVSNDVRKAIAALDDQHPHAHPVLRSRLAVELSRRSCPGLRMPCGSSARFTARSTASSSGVRE